MSALVEFRNVSYRIGAKQILSQLSLSVEQDSRWVGTVDAGLTYRLTGNLQFDAGVNLGVTDAADDINTFLGLAWRF
jgi:long-subunit fatty acid transport protein